MEIKRGKIKKTEKKSMKEIAKESQFWIEWSKNHVTVT